MAIDDVVPPGSTAQEAFMLMQQERINTLEADYAALARDMKAMSALLTPPQAAAIAPVVAAAAAPAVVWQPAPPLPPPPPLLPHAAIAVGIGMPLPRSAARERLARAARSCAAARVSLWRRWGTRMRSEHFLFSLFVITTCLSIPGFIVLDAGIDSLRSANTQTTALVTNVTGVLVPDSYALLCTTNFSFLSHDGAPHNGSALVAAQGGVCDQARVGTRITICYCWSRPADVLIGTCAQHHRQGRTMVTTAIVLLSVMMVPLAVWALYWALWGLFDRQPARAADRPWGY